MTPNFADARPSGRLAWLAVGIPLTVAALFFSSVNVLSWLGTQSKVEQRTFQAPVSRLDVSTGSGDIEVRQGDPGEVRVRRTITWSFGKPTFDEQLQGGTLSLHTDCGFTLAFRCSADYVIWVPAQMTVRTDTSSGDVSARDVTGDLQLSTSSGDITVRGASGDLRLSTSSGDIEADGGRGAFVAHTGSGDIVGTGLAADDVQGRTGSGDVSLLFARAPHQVSARTGSGNVEVTVPGHDDYRVTVDTGSGDEDVSVARDPLADRSISANTGSGDVLIRQVP